MNQNKNLVIAAVLIAIGIITAGFFVGQMHLKGKKYDRHVTVKGLAEREVMADVAIWAFTLTTGSDNLNTLKSKLDTDTREILGFVKGQGFSDEELSVGFPNIQDTRAQGYQGASDQLRYVARTDFTIRTGDLDKLHSTIEAMPQLIGEGVVIQAKNQWQPVQYLYTKLNDIKPPMIEEATKNAREVADKFAADSGSKVGKIKTARQGIFTITDRDPNTGYIKNVRIVTTIDYLLED